MSVLVRSRLQNLDPRTIPSAGNDADLPAVDPGRLTAAAIRARFLHPPVWQPEIRREPIFLDRPMSQAAVLLALVRRASGLKVLLTHRSWNLPTHAGQVAFAGGKAEAFDKDLNATALRETHEELGIEARFIEVVGQLPVYVTGSQFTITPVVALLQSGFKLKLEPAEVADAFEVPLEFLMNPANHWRHHYDRDGVAREWFSMPYDEPSSPGRAGGEHFIWGATAGMLRNFYRFMAA